MYVNIMLLLLFSIQFFINTASASSFVLTPDSPNYYLTTVEEGESFKIKCHTVESGLILWVRNIKSSQPEVLPPYSIETNYTIHYEPFWSILEIPNVTLADVGIYKCERYVHEERTHNYYCNKCSRSYISSTSSDQQGVELKIVHAPTITSTGPKILKLNLGERIELECTASGYPTPIIYWKRSNNTKFSTGGRKHISPILKITSLSYEDLGTYYCVADNTIGKPAIEVVKLIMRHKKTTTTSTTPETSSILDQSVEVILNEEVQTDNDLQDPDETYIPTESEV